MGFMVPFLGKASGGAGGGISATEETQTVLFDTTIGVGEGNFDFDPIPSGYSALKLLLMAESKNSPSATDNVFIRFNGDTAGNYVSYSVGNYTVSTNQGLAQTTGFEWYYTAKGSPVIDSHTPMVFRIPKYTESIYKQILSEYAYLFHATHLGWGVVGGYWKNTAAITRIQIIASLGGGFNQGSRAILLGVT